MSHQIQFSGAANPARDFGPRLLALMVYGEQAFTGDSSVGLLNYEKAYNQFVLVHPFLVHYTV